MDVGLSDGAKRKYDSFTGRSSAYTALGAEGTNAEYYYYQRGENGTVVSIPISEKISTDISTRVGSMYGKEMQKAEPRKSFPDGLKKFCEMAVAGSLDSSGSTSDQAGSSSTLGTLTGPSAPPMPSADAQARSSQSSSEASSDEEVKDTLLVSFSFGKTSDLRFGLMQTAEPSGDCHLLGKLDNDDFLVILELVAGDTVGGYDIGDTIVQFESIPGNHFGLPRGLLSVRLVSIDSVSTAPFYQLHSIGSCYLGSVESTQERPLAGQDDVPEDEREWEDGPPADLVLVYCAPEGGVAAARGLGDEWLATFSTSSSHDAMTWCLEPAFKSSERRRRLEGALSASRERKLEKVRETLAAHALQDASEPQISHPFIARLGETLAVWRVSTPNAGDFVLGRDADQHTIVLRVVSRRLEEDSDETSSVFRAFGTSTYQIQSEGGLCAWAIKLSLEATLGIDKGAECELVVLKNLGQPGGKHSQVPLGSTDLSCRTGNYETAHLVLRLVPTAADAVLVEFPLYVRKNGRDERQVPFADCDEKLVIAIMPSFQMGIEGQKEPFSATWYKGLAWSEINMNATRVALLARDEGAEIGSEAELKNAVQRFLVPLMRVDPSDPKSRPVPTSLYLGGHGSKGKVSYDGLGAEVAVSDLVGKIIGWLPPDLQGYLCHIHFDACESMSGVTSLDGVALSGYTAEVDTSTSTFFFSFLAAAAERALSSSTGVHAAVIAAELESPRTTDMGEALLASEVSMAELVAEFVVLPPLSGAKIHGAASVWYCDSCHKKGVGERHTLRGGSGSDSYDLCSCCYASATGAERFECVRPARSTLATVSGSAPSSGRVGAPNKIHVAPLEERVLSPLRTGLASANFSECQGYALSCKSCFDLVQLLPDDSVDLVCIDPPYGNKYSRTGGESYQDVLFTAEQWGKLLKEGWRVLKPGGRHLIFCSLGLYKELFAILLADSALNFKWHSWQRGSNSRPGDDRCNTWTNESNEYVLIVWIRDGVKGNSWYKRPVGSRDVEFLGEYDHPPRSDTVKPKALYQRVLQPYSQQGSRVVLDYCMYTGLCGEVALELGHNFIGGEILPKLFKQASTRLAALTHVLAPAPAAAAGSSISAAEAVPQSQNPWQCSDCGHINEPGDEHCNGSRAGRHCGSTRSRAELPTGSKRSRK